MQKQGGSEYLSCGFFISRRKGGLYAENEQETETRLGIVSERKKSHYPQRTLQKSAVMDCKQSFRCIVVRIAQIFIKKGEQRIMMKMKMK